MARRRRVLYVEMVRSSAIGRPALRRLLVAPFSLRTWEAQVHITLGFVASIAIGLVGCLALVAVVLSACTVVLLPVALYGILLGVRAAGFVERQRFALLLDRHLPDPYPPFTGGFWSRVRQRVTSAAARREVAYCLIAFPQATIGFLITVTSWSVSAALAALPFYQPALPGGVAHFGLFDVVQGPGTFAMALVGVLGLLASPWVARGWVAVDVFVASYLLSRGVTAELEDRVDVLETTRSWVLEVAEAERRRIERDLHDGAQQRLVALAISLGMAREKFDSDPDAARGLIDRAHDEAKAAIVELRDLARGIHPPDLGETGLPGALPVLAGRCPIPVELVVDVPVRPSPSVEGIVYFMVSECLANVAKHAAARHAGVRVTPTPGRLSVEVTDDGRGGASPSGGSGLRGLAERVASIDGTFTVSSPVGGPTTIRAELPCAS